MKGSKRRWALLRYNRKIRNALLTYYLTPILLILLASGAFFYLSARDALDEEMDKRLVSIVLHAADQVRGFHKAALALHDPTSRTYRNLKARFAHIRDRNHVARIYLFTPNNRSLLDTDGSMAPGQVYERNRLHLSELEQVRKGRPAASVLFQGEDGTFYKSAFAPVTEQGQVIAIAGVDGSVTFFQNLRQLGRQLAYFALACIAIIILVSIVISRKIVVPIQSLVEASQRIGEGHLETPLEVRSRNEIGFLGFVLDQMRKNIISRDRELQVMLQGIAHEVRNPLGGIELFAGMLEEEIKEPELRKSVDRIKKEVKTLKVLVEDFLDFARGPSLQLAKIELEPFFADLRIAFQKEMEENGISFETRLENAADGEFDVDQMRRAFLNLIRNAIQALPNGGEILLSAKGGNDYLEITVHDNGIGIPAEDLDKIFDAFFTQKDGGTGLGLSFVRKIVNAHGGEVRVASTPDKGTSVTIMIPR